MGLKQFFAGLTSKRASTEDKGAPARDLLFKDMAENKIPFSEDDIRAAAIDAARKAERQVCEELYAEERERQIERGKAEVISFCESGLKSGLIKKEWVENGLVEFMSNLSEDVAVFEFSEWTPMETRLEWFKGFLKSVNKLLPSR